MLNNPLMRYKMPYADQFTSTEEAVNYMVKTLNSTFRDRQNAISSSNQALSLLSLGTEFSQSWSIGGNTLNATYTFNHNFGTIPTGFLITDNAVLSGATGLMDNLTIMRLSWTTTQITVRIVATFGSGGPFTGSFKILVLR